MPTAPFARAASAAAASACSSSGVSSRSVCQDAAADAEDEVAGNELVRARAEQRVHFGHAQPRQLDHVLEPGIGDEREPRPLALDDGVDADRRAVDEVDDVARVEPVPRLRAARDPSISSPPGSSGVVRTFRVSTRLVPVSSAQKSMKVPPISTPIRQAINQTRPVSSGFWSVKRAGSKSLSPLSYKPALCALPSQAPVDPIGGEVVFRAWADDEFGQQAPAIGPHGQPVRAEPVADHQAGKAGMAAEERHAVRAHRPEADPHLEHGRAAQAGRESQS